MNTATSRVPASRAAPVRRARCAATNANPGAWPRCSPSSSPSGPGKSRPPAEAFCSSGRPSPPHVEAVGSDPEQGRPDLLPGSPACAAQLRMSTTRLVALANQAAGREAVRSTRVLPPGTAPCLRPGRSRTEAEGPVHTREAASGGFRTAHDRRAARRVRRHWAALPTLANGSKLSGTFLAACAASTTALAALHTSATAVRATSGETPTGPRRGMKTKARQALPTGPTSHPIWSARSTRPGSARRPECWNSPCVAGLRRGTNARRSAGDRGDSGAAPALRG